MINEDTPIDAWLHIHYLRNKGQNNIKVAYSNRKFMENLQSILNRNNQPFENPYGEDYMIAYPT